MEKFIPALDRVLIKKVEKETKKGSIIIPDTGKERPTRGLILAVGDNMKSKLWKVGKICAFTKYAGTDVLHEGEDCKVMFEKDLLGIIE